MMVSAILLGAGESKRMGKDKLSLFWGRQTIFERCFQTLLRSNVDQVIVVLSFQNKDKAPIFRNRKVKIIINSRSRAGMSTSIRAGLRAVPSRSEGVLIALGDQPLLKSRTVNALIRIFDRGREGIIVPMFREKMGHPVIFHRRYKKDLLCLKGDTGGKSIIKKYPEDVKGITVRSEGVVRDIDTWRDYKNCMKNRK